MEGQRCESSYFVENGKNNLHNVRMCLTSYSRYGMMCLKRLANLTESHSREPSHSREYPVPISPIPHEPDIEKEVFPWQSDSWRS